MQKQISPKIIALTFGVLVISFFAVFYAVAWTEPPYGGTCATPPCPPGGNVPPPINVGDTLQTKSGSLQVNGFRNIGTTVLDGNVGIGTASPGAKLDIFIADGSGNPGVRIGNNATNKYALIDYNDISDFFSIQGGVWGGTTRPVILQGGGGNVGIGTAGPAYKLDVSGDVRWTGTLQGGSVPWGRLTSFPSVCPAGQYATAIGPTLTCSTPAVGGGGDITGVIAGIGLTGGGLSGDVTLSADTGYLQRRVSGTCAAGFSIRVVNSDGTVTCQTDNVGITSESDTLQTITNRGATTNLAITVAGLNLNGGGSEGNILSINQLTGYNDLFIRSNSGENAAIYYAGSDQHFYTGGTERMTILNNGNVGIGTTDPGAKLEVAGQIKITGGSPGADKVLTSDASGLASWQTAAGGSGEYGYQGYVTITYLAGASNSCGSPQCQSVGVGVLCRKTTYYNPLGYYETGWEATCDGGYSGPYLLYNSAYNNSVTCEKSLYACIKTPFRGPGCGDGIVQGGEVCDDGNQVNDIGNCNANCSKVNYFGYPTKFVVDWNYYISINTQTTDKYCQEQGFTATLRNNGPLLTSPVARWNGSVWEKLSLGNFYYVIDLWCQ